MAQVRVQYTIPGVAGSTGAQVDVIFTYNENAPVAGQPANTFVATAATGTYRVLDANQNVVRTDTITGVGAAGNPSTGNANNYLAIGNVGTSTPIVVGSAGLNITKSNTANSSYVSGGVGIINIFRQGSDYTQDVEAPRSSTSSSSAIVCFVTGTLIRTTRGEVPVENLVIGDRAVTASGQERPIRWIGHRSMDPRRHSHPEQAMPVRIRAHALGPSKPARDLLVSPGHAICLDVLGEVLIPACSLVNGSTVVQEDVASVTYWHVELDSHDILLAEGLPAESYLDMGNRSFFANAEVTDLVATPDARPEGPLPFCRPFHETGPVVDLVRARLAEHAEALAPGYGAQVRRRA